MNNEQDTLSTNNREATPPPKVHLRAIEPEDLDQLYLIENDTALWNVGLTNVPYSRYLLHDYIANTSGDIYTDKQVRLIIEDGNHKVAGIIDLVDFSPRHLRAELGIVIKREWRRMGHAREALALMTDYARKVLHLHQLYAYIDTTNTAALSLFQSAGFRRSATLPQWLYDGNGYHDVIFFQLFL